MGMILALFVQLWTVQVQARLPGLPSVSEEAFLQDFQSFGNVRIGLGAVKLQVGLEDHQEAGFESKESGLLSSLEITMDSPLHPLTNFTFALLKTESKETVFSMSVSASNAEMQSWEGESLEIGRCSYTLEEKITGIGIIFGMHTAKLFLIDPAVKRDCGTVPFRSYGKKVLYRVSVTSSTPAIVTLRRIGWEQEINPVSALSSMQTELKSSLSALQKSIQSLPFLSSNSSFVSPALLLLEQTIDQQEQRIISLSLRWEALKATEYMTRPLHLIHHFQIVLRELEKEIGHLYDRIAQGALSEYAEGFIHERKEVMPMEVLLGAYAWQVEKKLSSLKEHIESMKRFTWVLALGLAILIAGIVSLLVLRRAEKLHKL